MFDKMTGYLLSFFSEVTHADAPHIFEALEELAARPKAGAQAKFSKVYILKETNRGVYPILDYIAGCMVHRGENILVLGRDIMKELGVVAPNAPVTQEFKAILAHEMGHAFHGDLKSWGIKTWSNLTPIVGVIGGIAGAYAAQKMMEKHPDDKEKQQAELEGNKELLKGANNGSLGAAAKVALYTAGVGLGLVAGVFGARALNYKMEFRADQYSKELMGGGEALANGLTALVKVFDRLRHGVSSAGRTDAETIKAFDRSRRVLEEFLHPPMGQRIEALVGR